MALNKVLHIKNDSELLSYIINQSPELSSEIDLPKQGESIAPIGKLIVSNERFKNAFINTVNVIGLTIIDRNYWEDPWENFTSGKVFSFGQSVRELAVDIAKVFDYNQYANNPTNFLNNVVPDIYNYIHNINYQKFYKTTTSDEQIAMAFTQEGELMGLIEEIIGSLFRAYQYDKYIVNKYMLCRRILDGTMSSVYIDVTNKDTRAIVEEMKAISNNMTFMKPYYNPAGLRVATPYEKQITILDTLFEAKLTTSVLATSYFRNDANFRSRLAIIDGYAEHDTARLLEVLGTQYVAFSDNELSQLSNVLGNIIDDEWFQNYTYSLDNSSDPNAVRRTDFFNPESFKNNHWLHYWGIKSTSPFKNGVVISKVEPGVTTIAVSPSSATVGQGSEIKLSAIVTTVGFANKAVKWTVESASGEVTGKVSVSIDGLVKVPSDYTSDSTITIRATSIYDTSKYADCTITVASTTVPSITSVTVKSAGNVTSIGLDTTLQMSATVVKTGNASTTVEWDLDDDAKTDGFTISSTGLITSPETATVDEITVIATSIFDTSKYGVKELTVSSQ